ncbi:MAG: hydrogenase [Planctomycetes bacterium]|nr:hydrogenase [Planctomycetota bacterium]
MNLGLETILVFLVLANIVVLASSRLTACIRAVAAQGIALGIFPLLAHDAALTARVLLLAAGSMVLKGIVFPMLLSRAARDAEVRREMEPFVGYTLSIVFGAAALAVALWIGSRLPLPRATWSPLVVPVALFTLFVGLFIIVSRKKALSQVLGYLVLENGIYAFGVALALEEPLLVELGVLLDVFVAVFVMGIAIFHISREFDHIDTDRMTTLRDWTRRRRAPGTALSGKGEAAGEGGK